MKYEVEVDALFTGSVVIEAESGQDAYDVVREMSDAEKMELIGRQLTVEEIEPLGVYKLE